VEVNQSRAVELYTLAADQGDAIAHFNLGLCHEQGRGVEVDRSRAAEFYTLSADLGYARARERLWLMSHSSDQA
jgi:uncharacterized protein